MNKTPCTTRPMVSTSGTSIAGLSKWLDYLLQKLRHQVTTYLNDSSHLIQILTYLGTLPPGAKIFTSDDKSMYTNIDKDHGTSQVENWIKKYYREIPTDFPTKAVKVVI